MGICTSCTSTSESTAKLILENGKLEEFSYPVKVSFLLNKHPNVFICNSDDMEFDAVLTAVRERDELQLGELYFALPLGKLGRPLSAEEMAALAVKANAALLLTGGGDKCGCKSKTGFFGKNVRKSSSKVADIGSATVKSGGKNVIWNGRRGRMLLANNLSVIPE
ncbi:hypothetical protein RND81_02G158300 [Saponaria officinalis]|uniref:Uncharacterized protein n=1 Tax=Saponaria officinalis TaxID=3572 RepID=A0AAW1MUG6_SAPOF